MAAYRDTFAIDDTLPYDESELTPNAEDHGRAVVRWEGHRRRDVHLFRENPGVRL